MPASRSRRQTQQSCPAPPPGWPLAQLGPPPGRSACLHARCKLRPCAAPAKCLQVCCCGRGAVTCAGPKSASTPRAAPSQLALWAAAGVLDSCPQAVAQLLPAAAQGVTRDLARILALHPKSRHSADHRVLAKAALASEALACLAENGLTASHLQSLLRCSTTPRQDPLPAPALLYIPPIIRKTR